MSGHRFKLAPSDRRDHRGAVANNERDSRVHRFRPQGFAEGDLMQSVTTSHSFLRIRPRSDIPTVGVPEVVAELK